MRNKFKITPDDFKESTTWDRVVTQAEKDYIEAGIRILNDKSLMQRFTPEEINEIMSNMVTYSASSKTAEQQYIAMLKDCYENGIDIVNERTGSICRTILNQRIQFDGNEFPLLTTRKMYWKQAIGEMVAYIRAYTKLSDFHSLGVHTWDKNAEGWTQRTLVFPEDGRKPYATDVPSTGVIYGASAERVNFGFKELLDSIKNNPNDRGHIWNFWNPEYFHKGCLRPCMYSHQFSVLDGTLHLSSTQRSLDIVLGGAFNLVQCWFLLNITAKLTGLKVGTVTWNITNAHIYGNQIPLVPIQLERPMYTPPKLIIKDDFDMDVLMVLLNKDNFEDYFELQDYKHHPAIKYPFTA